MLDFVASIDEPSFPTVYAATAVNWQISLHEMLHVYAWSWIENQVSAAMKAIPLGQVAGQQILVAVSEQITTVIEQAMQCADDDISNFCPALSIASCRHETQYSRLFRS
jgi:urease accessory protein